MITIFWRWRNSSRKSPIELEKIRYVFQRIYKNPERREPKRISEIVQLLLRRHGINLFNIFFILKDMFMEVYKLPSV